LSTSRSISWIKSMKSTLDKYFQFKMELPRNKHFTMNLYNPNDLYVCIEVNADGIITTEPMTFLEISRYITDKYKDQPLQYFNEYKRIKVIHLKSGEVRVAKIEITL